MINKIYLDLDGVLSDFNTAATAIIGAPYPPKEWHWYNPYENGFERVNEACTVEFWAGLSWQADGKEILNLVEQFAKHRELFLITTPMPNPGSFTGKALWVKKNVPNLYEKLIITTLPKWKFATEDSLLIDDSYDNIGDFIAAGGKGILVPRSWSMCRSFQHQMTKIIKSELRSLL